MSVNLNDRSAVTALDPSGMLAFTEDFPAQCRRALNGSRQVAVEVLDPMPSLAMLTGLGGSAAGGDLVRALFEAQASIPFLVNRDYHLPSYVKAGDVVFCASYSGNTEETLSAYEDAKNAGARVFCVTSGGKLKEQAEADGFTVVTVPGGQPPRTALGYMLIPVIDLCVRLGLLPPQDFEDAFRILDESCLTWTVEGLDDHPKVLARALHGAFGILYGLGSWQGFVAYRWRCQINENSKNLALHHTFPELCHNEILGWVQADCQGVERYVVVMLADGSESAKMRTRYEVTKRLLKGNVEFFEVQAPGENLLTKMLNLTFYGDFVSIYLAALNEVDPENIDSINILKDELSLIA